MHEDVKQNPELIAYEVLKPDFKRFVVTFSYKNH